MNSAQYPSQSIHSAIVFVDANVEDYEVLLHDIGDSVTVKVLTPGRDGVHQITQVLAGDRPFDHVQLICHGAPGLLKLGNTELSLTTLDRYAEEVRSWFDGRSATASLAISSLAIYSCNVAAGDAGTEFLERLHQLTGVTLRASAQPVGNAAQGGSWDLAIGVGSATEVPSVLNAEALAMYTGVLNLPQPTGTDNHYRYIDSRAAGGFVAFEDISTSITATRYDLLDEAEQGVVLPFDFNFYGTISRNITIADNGAIVFNTLSGNVSSNNGSLPRSNLGISGTMGMLPFWTNLAGGQVFTETRGSGSTRRFIIQWNNFTHEDRPDDAVTFQVVLYESSNNLAFVYADTVFGDVRYNDGGTLDYGAAATVGLNRSSSVGLQYSLNAPSLNGVSSIRFLAEPRIVNNTLTIQEGQSVTLTQANLFATDVDSNDPTRIRFDVSNVQNGQFLLNDVPTTTFTQAQINASQVKFVHNGGELAPSYTVAVTDNFNPAQPQQAAITFSTINDLPGVSGLASSVSFLENALNTAPALLYGSTVAVTDVDSPNFEGGTLTVSYTGGSSTADRLAVLNGGGISVSDRTISFNGSSIGLIDITNDGTTGKSLQILLTSPSATLAAVEALIESLAYQTTSDTPATTRTISVVVNDGDGGTIAPISTTINVTASNDAPSNTVPAAQTIAEDTVLTFANSTQIAIADPDAGGGSVRVTLTATNGTLSLSGTSGLIFAPGNGTPNRTIIMTGSVSAINAALNGMTFTPDVDFNGAASVQILTDDRENSGVGGPLTATNTINITVTAANDTPVNTVPGNQSIPEDTSLVFNLVNANAISISDVDVSEQVGGTAQVTLSVTQGTLRLSQTTGLSFSEGTGTGDSIMTFSGTIANINAALNGLSYQGNANFSGSDTLTIVTSDRGNTGDGGIRTDTDTIAITVTPVNDDPVNTVPGAQSVNEDANLVFHVTNNNRISVGDLDAAEGNGLLQVTLSVNNGTLSLAQTTGLTLVSGDGTKVVTFRGTVANLNAALNGLIYRGDQNFNGSDTLTITTNDIGNVGSGGPKADTDTIALTIVPTNDIPIITDLAAIVSLNENDLNTAPRTIDDVVTVIDVDSTTFGGGNLSVVYTSLGGPEDQLTIRNQGTGAGQIGFDGITVTFGGTAIGTADAALDGRNGRGLSVLLNNNTNATNVKALIQQLVYQNISNTPIPNRTIAITLNDGNGGTSNPISSTINVTPQNDPPVLGNNSLTVLEGETVILDARALSAIDVDNPLPDLIFTVSNVQNGSFRVNGVTRTSFTQAEVSAGLVRFAHDGSEAPPSYQMSVGDGAATTTAQAATIAFTNVNDAPVIAGLVSSVDFVGTEVNAAPELLDESVTVTDIDSTNFGGGTLTISYSNGGSSEDQLSFQHQGTGAGQIGFNGTTVTFGGVAIGTVSSASNGSNGQRLVVALNTSATPDAVKALLQRLTYRNTSDTPIPSRTISVTLDDGDGGVSTAVQSVIHVASENDPPAIAVPTAQTINEDSTLVFNANTRLLVTDPDAGDSPLQVKLTVTQGTLTLSRTTGLTFASGDGIEDATTTVTGNLASINAALEGALFKPTTHFNGIASVQVEANDLGNTGSDGPKSATNLVTINVDAVNDAPSIISLDTRTVAEDTALPLVGNDRISIGDVDAGTSPVLVTLMVSHGTLTFGRTDGVTFSQGNGQASPSLTFSGTLAAINAALESLTYQPKANYHGADQLAITVSDQGNTGAGGTLLVNRSVGISVIAVNDAPTNTVPAPQIVDEDTDLVFSDLRGNAITIGDLDVNEGTGLAEVTLSVSKGTLTLAQTTGLTFPQGQATTAPSLTLSGTVADINAALNGLIYRSTLNYNGKDTLVMTTNDRGNAGSGGIRSDSDAIDITVTAVNDAPVITGTPRTSVDEEFAYEFVPSAQDIDSTALTFSIQNKPAWATFDPATGRLSGTPAPGTAGTTADIVIGVSDGVTTTNLAPFNLTVIAKAIDGSSQPDQIDGRDKADVINGFDGNDVLRGGEGGDLLYGGAGNDNIFGGNGDDGLYGEEGNDILHGENGNDGLYGGVGSDQLLGAEGLDKLYGGRGGDTLSGGQENDELYGEQGDDELLGGSGNDLLAGGAGNDELVGSLGNDYLLGGVGNDLCSGGRGNDILVGFRGDDVLDGGEGRNQATGGLGSDVFVLTRRSFTIIQDFANQFDRIVIAGVNAQQSFGQLEVTQSGRNTVIGYQNRAIASLIGVNANLIDRTDFLSRVPN